jgi:hypothetical protein
MALVSIVKDAECNFITAVYQVGPKLVSIKQSRSLGYAAKHYKQL